MFLYVNVIGFAVPKKYFNAILKPHKNMINFDKFFPTPNYKGDFLLSLNPDATIDEKMDRLVKHDVVKTNNGNLYLINFPRRAAPGDCIFSGISKEQGRIVYGPLIDNFKPDPIGRYYWLRMLQDKIEVHNDFFGMQPIFYGRGFVSNRMQLIYLMLKDRADIFNNTIIHTNLVSANWFNEQLCTFDTFIDGVKVMPVGRYLEVKSGEIKVINKNIIRDEPGSEEEYFALIDKARDEILDNVKCAVDTFENVQCQLTGGVDSRINYGALVALGYLDKVFLHTRDVGKDRAIASGLAGKFGGKYAYNKSQIRYTSNIEDNLDNFISQSFFQKFEIPPEFLNAHISQLYGGFVSLGGATGEIFRSYWHSMQFNVPIAPLTHENFNAYFDGLTNIHDHYAIGLPPIYRTFEELDGELFSDKFEYHYVNFGNVFHFGGDYQRTDIKKWYTLLSPSLFNASRCLPPGVRKSGRVLFDITRALVPELAYYEYDTAKPDYSLIPYHRKHLLDGQVLPLEYNMTIFDSHNWERTLPIIAQINNRDIVEYLYGLLLKMLPGLEGTEFSFFNNNFYHKVYKRFYKESFRHFTRYFSFALQACFVAGLNTNDK